jgi:hypothetical protein
MRIVFRSSAHKAKLQNAHPVTTYVITVDVADVPSEERHRQIKRIFESPLGCHVSEATLGQNGVHVVLHVPADKMKSVYPQLGKLLPEAVVQGIRPRGLDLLHDRALS